MVGEGKWRRDRDSERILVLFCVKPDDATLHLVRFRSYAELEL